MEAKCLLHRVILLFLICLIPLLSGCSATTRMILQAEGGRTHNVALMLDKGLDVDGLLIDRTALFYTSQNGHAETVELLLNRGANPNLKDERGVSPLRLAAEYGHLEVVNILLAAGADPNIKTKDYGNLALHAACSNGHIDIISILLEQGDHLNLKNRIGMTPLIMAARHGHDDLVKMLIEQGAIIDIKEKSGLTALHFACVHGNGEMLPALLAAGADPNLKTSEGLTPLHYMATQKNLYPKRKKEYPKRKEILISAGADPSILSNFKQSADDVYTRGLLIPSKGDGWARLFQAQDSANVTSAMALHQFKMNTSINKTLPKSDIKLKSSDLLR